MNLNERAVKAAGNEEEFQSLLAEYKPFIASCACRTTGRNIDEHDDYMSIAMIAFSEAVRRYREKSGAFLPFASKVIKSRLIDCMREEKRNVSTLSIEQMADHDGYQSRLEHKGILVSQPESRYDSPIKLEIDALTQELKLYGFRFTDVAKCSPTAVKTKSACKKAARHLAGDTSLLGKMAQTRMLPLQELEAATGVSRKTIGRHRNYIVCLALILSGEYDCLAEYISKD